MSTTPVPPVPPVVPDPDDPVITPGTEEDNPTGRPPEPDPDEDPNEQLPHLPD
jgi:hypothetical protein